MKSPAEQEAARTRYAVNRDRIRKQIKSLLAEGKSFEEIEQILGLDKESPRTAGGQTK